METTSLRASLDAVRRQLEGGARRVRLHGCDGSLPALVLADLVAAKRWPRPVVALVGDQVAAERLARDLEFFLPRQAGDDPAAAPRVMVLPEIDTSPWAEISPDRRAILRRMAVLFRLAQGMAGDVLVASAPALARRVMPRAPFSSLVDVLQAEQEIDREATIALLERGGYRRAPVVEDPGTYAVRGGVLDVFSPLYRFPVRVELLGDLVETMRLFDPATQRTLRLIDEIFLHPVRETVLTDPDGLRARLLAAGDRAAHPSSQTRAVMERIEAGEDFFGIEGLVPALHRGMGWLAEYLPPDALLFVDEPAAIIGAVAREEEEGREVFEARLGEHRLVFPPEEVLVSPAEVGAFLAGHPCVESRLLDEAGDDAPGIALRGESNRELSAELRRAMSERHEELLRPLVRRLKEWRADGGRAILVCPTLQQAERLAGLLRGYGLEPSLQRSMSEPPRIAPPGAEERGRIDVVVGPLGRGLRLETDALWLVTDGEIFGDKAARTAPPSSSRAALRKAVDTSDFKNLEPGGYVVHRVHGVGIYRGLTRLPVAQKGGAAIDFLHLEYDGGALYLPVWRLDEVQRYVGADQSAPKLDRMGGQTWEKTRSRVSREVKKLAEDLLQIYAQRRAMPGHSFRLDEHSEQYLREFEATFAFEETADQQRAIDETLADMEEARPMDRLVCGDVGYGKTEVAMRAAIKAVLGGKQVGVLAPTTVLVEQHAATFAERMKDAPVKVASLSRFKSRAEQLEVIKALAEGKLDIVVGTHRLLSSDVRFKDLGLLIIDEEHRFGVSHKERIRALRTQIDCLTLTATPIPRTLNMAMMGLREISIITTAPADRLAVRTLVARLDDSVLVEGIRRELGRGGQVFFVHNLVEDIHDWQGRLHGLFPEARIGVGHGQMPAEELERVMVEFVGGKLDILVCTTIIESGLDIGRANTMFVNRADCFGLAQLYQLRGRIGRSKERAYCYLLVPPEAKMSSEAKQRLAVLQRFTELGAGFQIASHDLEIRGAGDLLGAKQSGHIAAVGFDMYTQLLEEAVAALQGREVEVERDPELTCDLPGFLPEDYVPDTGQRLDFYKRLSVSRDEQEIGEVLDELRDRYGEPPEEVVLLSGIMTVKALGRRLMATAIELSELRLALALDEKTPLKPEQVMRLVNRRRSPWRLTPDMRLVRSWAEEEKPRRLALAGKLLGELLEEAAKG